MILNVFLNDLLMVLLNVVRFATLFLTEHYEAADAWAAANAEEDCQPKRHGLNLYHLGVESWEVWMWYAYAPWHFDLTLIANCSYLIIAGRVRIRFDFEFFEKHLAVWLPFEIALCFDPLIVSNANALFINNGSVPNWTP